VADLDDAGLERSRRTVYRALGDLLERGAVTKDGRVGRGGTSMAARRDDRRRVTVAKERCDNERTTGGRVRRCRNEAKLVLDISTRTGVEQEFHFCSEPCALEWRESWRELEREEDERRARAVA
jgi:hypothetical protein